MKLTNEMIEKAKAAIEADEKHEIFAIRTQDVPFEAGRIDHKSLVWIDGEMTDEDLQELLNVKKTRAYLLARQMNENGLIEIIGRGAGKKYKLK